MWLFALGHPRVLGGAAILSLGAAACGGGAQITPNQPAVNQPAVAPNQSATTAQAQMPMQAGAENMKTTIQSPATGSVVTGNAVTLQVTTAGFVDTCGLAGKADVPGKGHYHVLIDKALVNMFCTPTATVSMQNLKPGKHALTVVPAQNDHVEVEANADSVTVDYEPTAPLATIPDTTGLASPSLKILSPKPGAVLSGPFDVVVAISNFNDSCELLGKPDVAGYGHWHINLDSTSGPMMGMGTMLGMSCTNVFHADTAGLQSGSTHSIIALLTGNGHAPLMPAVSDKVEVTIG